MQEPVWLNRRTVDAVHFDQIRQHGGSSGIRDEGALESALSRPRNKWAYEPESDLAALAASYGFGLAKNHAFFDGNKRVAFMAMYIFLGLNGLDLEVSEQQAVQVMLSMASSRINEKEVADWLRKHMVQAEF